MREDKVRIGWYVDKSREVSKEVRAWLPVCLLLWFGGAAMAIGSGTEIDSAENRILTLSAFAMFVGYRWRRRVLYKQLNAMRDSMTQSEISEASRQIVES